MKNILNVFELRDLLKVFVCINHTVLSSSMKQNLSVTYLQFCRSVASVLQLKTPSALIVFQLWYRSFWSPWLLIPLAFQKAVKPAFDFHSDVVFRVNRASKFREIISSLKLLRTDVVERLILFDWFCQLFDFIWLVLSTGQWAPSFLLLCYFLLILCYSSPKAGAQYSFKALPWVLIWNSRVFSSDNFVGGGVF